MFSTFAVAIILGELEEQTSSPHENKSETLNLYSASNGVFFPPEYESCFPCQREDGAGDR